MCPSFGDLPVPDWQPMAIQKSSVYSVITDLSSWHKGNKTPWKSFSISAYLFGSFSLYGQNIHTDRLRCEISHTISLARKKEYGRKLEKSQQISDYLNTEYSSFVQEVSVQRKLSCSKLVSSWMPKREEKVIYKTIRNKVSALGVFLRAWWNWDTAKLNNILFFFSLRKAPWPKCLL